MKEDLGLDTQHEDGGATLRHLHGLGEIAPHIDGIMGTYGHAGPAFDARPIDDLDLCSVDPDRLDWTCPNAC
jgi:hypothetical protein